MGNLLSYELGRAPDPGPEPLLSRARPKPPNTKLTLPLGRIGSFAYAGTTPLLGIPRTVQFGSLGQVRQLLQQVAWRVRARGEERDLIPGRVAPTWKPAGVRPFDRQEP